MINILGLIEFYNTYEKDSIYHDVSASLLEHFTELSTMTSQEIADLCNVSLSTLTRFYKMMGYTMTVSNLPDLFGGTIDNYYFSHDYMFYDQPKSKRTPTESYLELLVEHIQKLDFNRELAWEMLERMIGSEKVVFLGLPIPQSVWRFQVDLTMEKIPHTAYLDPTNQYDELENIVDNTFVYYFQSHAYGATRYLELMKNQREKMILATITNSHKNPISNLADYNFDLKGRQSNQDAILIDIYIHLLAITFKELMK